MANDIFPGAKLMQLVEWGYPMRIARPTPDPQRVWSVIHITGNSRLPSGENEATWRIKDPGTQNSATFFVNRDGSVVQTLGDPLHMDPYANGDWNAPDLGNPRIAWWYQRRSYYNPNELTLVAIENVGYEPGHSITAAQEETNARIIAHYHKRAGVPINRQTVIGHFQLNSVTRWNCPATNANKAVVDRIAARAAALLNPPKEDDMDARPSTFYPRLGRVTLAKGRTYNAFRFFGMQDGKPILERYNNLQWGGSSAHVIGRAHWDSGVSFKNSYLVSPYVWIPGGAGNVPLVWWSQSPLPEPSVTWDDSISQEDYNALKADRDRLAARVVAKDAHISRYPKG